MNSSRAITTAIAQRGSSVEVPADDHAGDDQQPVDDRVEQRAEPAVLAGQARGEAVEVVRPADHREQDRRQRVLAVALDRATTRNTGISASRDDSRSRWGSSTGSAAGPDRVCGGGGPERSIPNRRRGAGSRLTRASAASPDRTGSGKLAPELGHRLAPRPSSRHAARLSRPRRICTSISPPAERAPPDRHPQRDSRAARRRRTSRPGRRRGRRRASSRPAPGSSS